MASLDDKGQTSNGPVGAEERFATPATPFARLPDPWQENHEGATPAAAAAPQEDLDSILADLQSLLARPPAPTAPPDRESSVEPAAPPPPEPAAEPPVAASPTEPSEPAIAWRDTEEVPWPLASTDPGPEATPAPPPEAAADREATAANLEATTRPPVFTPPNAAQASEADALLAKLQSLALDALNRQPLTPESTSESSLELKEPATPLPPEAVMAAVSEPEPEPDPEPEPEPEPEPDPEPEPEPEPEPDPSPLASAFEPPAAVPAAELAPASHNGSNGAATAAPASDSPAPLFKFGDRDHDPLEVLRELLLSPEPGVGAKATTPAAPAPPARRPPPAPPRRLVKPEPPAPPPAAPETPKKPTPPAPKPAPQPEAEAAPPPEPQAAPNPAEAGTPEGVVVPPSEPAPKPAAMAAIPSVQEVEATYLRQLIADLETKLQDLEKQVYQPTEVINPLLPLIAQLMKARTNMNEEAVYTAVVPVLDRAIRERSTQDRAAMSEALAELIPDAISEEVKRSPDTIAKALGPEMASAISEQIKLQKDAISKALGPEMGRAIKAQIELERDAMVDALYPVIGNTIAKYMGEVVAQINEKVETALSPAGLQRKLRARLQGVSEAELILQESMPTEVQAIFLIHKASGLVISEIQPALEARLEPNMVAGMLTAIRSFVNDCIAQSGEISELNEIEYGDSRIILEVAGYCYLALVVRGTPRPVFVKRMQRTLMQIVRKYSREIEEFEGDQATIPPELHTDLAVLGESDIMTPNGKPRRRSRALLWLILAIIAFLLLPWAFFQVRGFLARRLETKIEAALTDLDDKAYTTLEAEVQGNRVILEGRVPSEAVKAEAAQMVAGVAPNHELDNNIITVQDPSATAMSVQLLAAALNRDPGIDLTAEYQGGVVMLRGQVSEAADRQQLVESFEQIPGVTQVQALQLAPAVLQERLYFDLNSAAIQAADRAGKLAAIATFLEASPDVQLKIIGHSDEQGSREVNEIVARDRAAAVRDALVDLGLEPERLLTEAIPDPPTDLGPEAPRWQGRCVRFELVLARE